MRRRSRAPRRARDTTRAYVCKLRQALEPWDVAIVRRPAGYLLAVEPSAVDLHRFRRLVTDSSEPATYAAALGLFRAAGPDGHPVGR